MDASRNTEVHFTPAQEAILLALVNSAKHAGMLVGVFLGVLLSVVVIGGVFWLNAEVRRAEIFDKAVETKIEQMTDETIQMRESLYE